MVPFSMAMCNLGPASFHFRNALSTLAFIGAGILGDGQSILKEHDAVAFEMANSPEGLDTNDEGKVERICYRHE
jgi:hypothetical protein